jgi:hypothetical protein
MSSAAAQGGFVFAATVTGHTDPTANIGDQFDPSSTIWGSN